MLSHKGIDPQLQDMTPIAYTISPYLTRFLDRTETARQQLVLAPLPPPRELDLQFAATIDRVYFGLQIMKLNVQVSTIKTILANQIAFAMQKRKGENDPTQINVLRYKYAFDYIRRNWLLNQETVTIKHLKTLYEELTNTPLHIPDKTIHEALINVQATSDNPYIQSATAKLVFKHITENDPYTESFSTMCCYLFLYRGGRDVRGLLVLEKGWLEDNKLFEGHYHTGIAKANITSWIEYFIKNLALSLEDTQQKLYQKVQLEHQKGFDKLNERQKIILTLLDDPHAIITNRTVQKIFHISQITASRDLAKLTMLGLLFSQGKGRSVRYTKI